MTVESQEASVRIATSRRSIFVARPLSQHEAVTLEAAYRLRAAVFAHELGWVPVGRDGRERDRCDDVALHFAAFAGRAGGPMLAGYARVLLPEQTFMLEREFSALLAGQALRTDPERAFEVSRFVVHPAYRRASDADGRGVANHLARAITRWALACGRTDWYAVCEVRHIRALRLRGLPFAHFGRTVAYQRGVWACAARLSIPEAAARLRERHMRDYLWYTQGAPAPWMHV
jgi:N-acyl-L-homoserine lactone synthetase